MVINSLREVPYKKKSIQPSIVGIISLTNRPLQIRLSVINADLQHLYPLSERRL